MTRLHRVLVPLLLLLAIYALAWLFVEDLPLIGQAHPQQYLLLVSNASDDSHRHVYPADSARVHGNEQIPVLVLAALGGYCVFELVWGVISMGNADEAYKELQKVR